MIKIDLFIEFCKSLVGSRFKTAGGRAEFILSSAQHSRLRYYVVSTGKIRDHTRRRIKMVLARFGKTRSLRQADYKGISVNQPYILALISLYCSKHPLLVTGKLKRKS